MEDRPDLKQIAFPEQESCFYHKELLNLKDSNLRFVCIFQKYEEDGQKYKDKKIHSLSIRFFHTLFWLDKQADWKFSKDAGSVTSLLPW